MGTTTTIPYFKFDSGRFLSETMGFSSVEIGIYIQAMALYWERGCRLPALDVLKRSLRVTTRKEREALDLVIDTFFPDGIHEHLDRCLDEAQAFSRKQSAKATKGHEQRKQPNAREAPPSASSHFDPDDF